MDPFGESPEGPAEAGLLLHELTRDEASARAGENLLVLPVGATEQHGRHLPLGTDSLLAEHIARAAAQDALAKAPVLVTPTLPFGSSHHHLPFGGTASLGTERYYGALADVVESLIGSGFRRIFILNGHGGNHELVQLVARDLALRHPVNLAAASYWEIARTALIEADPASSPLIPGHAGLFETSLVLAIRPSLVRELPAGLGTAERQLPTARLPYRAELHGSWQDIAGFTDRPDLASRERGERYLGIIVPLVRDAFVEFSGMPLPDP